MSKIVDAVNNPFVVDDTGAPPTRSAFAILAAERDELDRLTVEEILGRARRTLRQDRDLSCAYGRSLTDDDLAKAAELLQEPQGRLVNELFDFRHHHFDLTDLPELAAAVAACRERLGEAPQPMAAELALVAKLIRDVLDAPRAPSLDPLAAPAPELPEMDELTDGLI